MTAPGPERVTLDQLLGEAPDDAGAAPAGETGLRRLPWLLRYLGFAVVVAGGIFAVLRVFGFFVPYVVLAGSLFAMLMLRRVLKLVAVPPPPPALRSPAWGVTDDDDPQPVAPPEDGVVSAVRRWEARFAWTERDRARYATAVLPRVRELADERLRQRHGLTLASEPDRARRLVGPAVWRFLNEPSRRGPTPAELAEIVAELEKI
jgi:hypothetical protein